MRKVNQSYAYEEDQIAWIKEHFEGIKSFTSDQKVKLERAFKKRFKLYRSFHSLRVKAHRLGFRPSVNKLKIGVSRRVGKPEECDYVLVSLKPFPKYTPVDRYVWENSTGDKLSQTDIIINLNGVEHLPKIESLRKISRSELLIVNKLSKDIPLETRLIIAQVRSKVNGIEGRGEWASDEREWLMKNGKRHGGHNFWVKLAERLNALYDKKRSNRDLIMMYYNRIDNYEKI